MKPTAQGRRWLSVAAVMVLVATGWGAFLVTLVQAGGWASLVRPIAVTGLLAAMVFAFARFADDMRTREIVMVFTIGGLLFLIVGVLL